jgi:hypothetical protein
MLKEVAYQMVLITMNTHLEPVANTQPSEQKISKSTHTSKMPANILKACQKKSIQQQTMGSGGGPTFSLEDVQVCVNNGNSTPTKLSTTRLSTTDIPTATSPARIITGRMITMTEKRLDD